MSHNYKATHYWTQLRLALTAGSWSAKHPGKAPNGAVLTWSDLLRKFNKHCKGFGDVAEIANYTQGLGVWLSGPGGRDDGDDEGLRGSGGEAKWYIVDVEDECLLREESREDAARSFEELKRLNSTNSDSLNFLLAYYAYALGSPHDCLAYLAQVPDIAQLQNHISSATSTRSNTLSVMVPTSLTPSLSSLTAVGSTVSEANVAESLKDGRAWAMTEAFRSICLQGISNEKLCPEDSLPALRCYASALPLFRLFAHELSVITNPPSAQTGSIASALSLIGSSASLSSHTQSQASTATLLQSTSLYLLAANLKQRSKIDYNATFEKFRETWRWVERILRRAILILARTWDVASGKLSLVDNQILATSPTTIEGTSARTSQFSQQSSASGSAPSSSRASSVVIAVEPYNFWTWLEYYTMFSAFWPPQFRSAHRSTICVIYMRALILKYGGGATSTGLSPDGSRSPTPTPGQLQPQTQPANELTPRPQPQPQWHLQLHSDEQPHSIAPKMVIQEYKSILEATTRFPKAGERNWRVEEFVDLCVALWEALDAGASISTGGGKGQTQDGGEQKSSPSEGLSTALVIDVLWWATRLTFKSHRVLRHLIRLLYASGDVQLAKRTLKLYVQIVSKAWETRECEEAPPGTSNGDASGDEKGIETGGGGEDEEGLESSEKWIETLVFGVKMLCKSAALAGSSCSSIIAPILSSSGAGAAGGAGGLDPASAGGASSGRNASNNTAGLALRLVGSQNAGGGGLEARADVREAGKLVEKARKSLEDVKKSRVKGEEDEGYRGLKASVEQADGVYHTVLALIEHEPSTRPDHLEAAHNLFRASISTYPTPSAYFYLALSYARPGPLLDLEIAIECAGKAVETDPKEVRYWHLLGLLLAKMERWKDAEEILERGAALGEEDVDQGEQEQGRQEGSGDTQNGTDEEDVASVDDMSFTEENTIRPPNTRRTLPVSLNDFGGRKRNAFVIPFGAKTLPPASLSVKPALDLPSSRKEVFEYALQLRMSQIALTEVIQGAEGAGDKALDIFAWIAAKRGAAAGAGSSAGGGSSLSDGASRPSMSVEAASTRTKGTGSIFAANGSANKSSTNLSVREPQPIPVQDIQITTATVGTARVAGSSASVHMSSITTAMPANEAREADGSTLIPPPIMISPATPDVTSFPPNPSAEDGSERDRDRSKRHGPGRRSQSVDREKDSSKGKKVQQMLKNRVREERVRITAISRKIGHGVAKSGALKKAISTPDFHAVLRPTSYQASSIHSRRRLGSIIHHDRTPNQSPPPPPPPPPTMPPLEKTLRVNSRMARENRILSDLWLMTAATFRRQGKIEQARGAIQEAEVRDESNPSVWVQLGLYYIALGHQKHAIDAFQKALFINPDDVGANVHLARVYLTPPKTSPDTPLSPPSSPTQPTSLPSPSPPCPPLINPSTTTSQVTAKQDDIDLAAGLLSYLTRGTGWDIPEAWYYLSKAYGLQGRREKEREAITCALRLSEHRGIRDLGVALGWCL